MPKTEVEQEPSIEEILSSIRQIISDDDESPAAAVPAAPKASTPSFEDLMAENAGDEEDDVLELTQRLDEAPRPAFKPEPEPMPDPNPPIEVLMKDIAPTQVTRSCRSG
jgi:uncharacterized protein